MATAGNGGGIAKYVGSLWAGRVSQGVKVSPTSPAKISPKSRWCNCTKSVTGQGLPPWPGSFNLAPNTIETQKNRTGKTVDDPGTACPICSKILATPVGVKIHMRLVHKTADPSNSSGQSSSVTLADPPSHTRAEFPCPEAGCERSFHKKVGLQLHRQKAHPQQYNAGITVDRVKARWDPQDRQLLAKVESELILSNGGKVPLNINELMVEKFRSRTFDSIKSQRRRPEHRAQVEAFLKDGERSEEYESANSSFSSTGSSPGEVPGAPTSSGSSRLIHHDVRVNTSEGAHRLPTSEATVDNIRSLLSDITTEAPLTKFQRLIWPVAQRFKDGLSYEQELQHFLTLNVPKATIVLRRDRRKGPPVERVLTKRQQRRVDYANIQTLYKKDRSRAAKTVLDGTCSSTITDESGFIEYWSNVMTETPPPPMPDGHRYNPDEALTSLANPISIAEVEWALKGPKKAVGPDGIDLKGLRSLDSKSLCCLLNMIFASPNVPESLRPARVAFVPKEPNTQSPDKFRPIAIGSYVQRTLNKILARRARDQVTISGVQRAFIPTDGTFENLNVIDAVIHDARMRLRELRLVSIDLKKAFDMVTHDAISRAIKKRGFPLLFTRYVESLYRDSRTIIGCGTLTSTITPSRGVRQGDPLSPTLFNLVMDEILGEIESQGFGYELPNQAGRMFGLAFADDLLLVTSTKATMQCLLNRATPLLGERGLQINTSKSFSMSLVPSGRDKKTKVVDNCEFMVGSHHLPAKTITERWKYLGIKIDDKGRAQAPTDHLASMLETVTKAPLKPEQRLVILRDYVVPRILHTLVCGSRPGITRLECMDRGIRNTVLKKWLKMPPGVPSAFVYTSAKQGGLGIPCLRTLIPRLRLRRLERLSGSSDPFVKWAAESHKVRRDIEITRKHTWYKNVSIRTRAEEMNYWSQTLYNSIDGKHLELTKYSSSLQRWTLGMPFLSGKEFISLLKLRINALPTQSRSARGQPSRSRLCRQGCNMPESLNHVLQCCESVALPRVMRHHDLLHKVSTKLTEIGYTVLEEPPLGTVRQRAVRPDLVVITPTHVWVMDAEIVGTARNIEVAHQQKKAKYNDERIRSLLPNPELPRIFSPITATYGGLWHPQTIADLIQLGIPKKFLTDLTVQLNQSSLRIFRAHQASPSCTIQPSIPPSSSSHI